MKNVMLSILVLSICSNAKADLGRYIIDIDIDHYHNVVFNDEVTTSKNPDDIKKNPYFLDITNEDFRKQRSKARDILRRAQEVKQKLEIESFRFSLDNNLHAANIIDNDVEAKETAEMKIKLSEKVNEKLQEIDRETSRLLFQSYIDLHNSFYEELSISYSQYDQDLSTRGLYSKTFEYPHIDMTFLDVEDEDTHLRFCQKYGFNKVSDFKSRTVNSVCYHPLSRDKDERVNHLISGENVINIKYYEKCIPILTDINSLDGIETQKFEVLEKITCENSQNVGEKIGSFIDKFNIDERHFDKQSDSDNQSLKSNQKTSDNSSGVRR